MSRIDNISIWEQHYFHALSFYWLRNIILPIKVMALRQTLPISYPFNIHLFAELQIIQCCVGVISLEL